MRGCVRDLAVSRLSSVRPDVNPLDNSRFSISSCGQSMNITPSKSTKSVIHSFQPFHVNKRESEGVRGCEGGVQCEVGLPCKFSSFRGNPSIKNRLAVDSIAKILARSNSMVTLTGTMVPSET